MTRGDQNDARKALLHDLLAGAEGCGPAARRAQGDELADFLSGIQDEIVGEARRPLAQRAAE